MENHMNTNTAQADHEIGALFDQGMELGARARGKIVAGAKVTHKAVRKYPYRASGIALGVGAILGFLLTRNFRG
jgi:ElaB/YqjD/DUF883 family membrane-anchored ribosome-binding protein